MENRPTLEDRADIIDLLTEFTGCLDEHRFTDLPKLFTSSGGLRFGERKIRGAENLSTIPEADLTRYHLTQHLVSNHAITVTGDTATLRASAIGTHVIEPGQPSKVAMIGGRYDCDLIRVDGEWKFETISPMYQWFLGEPLQH